MSNAEVITHIQHSIFELLKFSLAIAGTYYLFTLTGSKHSFWCLAAHILSMGSLVTGKAADPVEKAKAKAIKMEAEFKYSKLKEEQEDK